MLTLEQCDENGAFLCSTCKSIISPDDVSNTTYKVLYTVVKDGVLTNIVVKCHCGTEAQIVLVGSFVTERTLALR